MAVTDPDRVRAYSVDILDQADGRGSLAQVLKHAACTSFLAMCSAFTIPFTLPGV